MVFHHFLYPIQAPVLDFGVLQIHSGRQGRKQSVVQVHSCVPFLRVF